MPIRIAAATLDADREFEPTGLPNACTFSDGVDQLLIAARKTLGMQLALLARLEDASFTIAAIDRAIQRTPDPRHELNVTDGERFSFQSSYCARMLQGAIPHSVPDVRSHPTLAALPVTEDVGIGAYCGVPVRLPDGTLYGTLCGLHPVAKSRPTSAQLVGLQTIAAMIGHRVAAEAAAEQQRQRDAGALLTLIDRGQLLLQPIVDLVDGRTVGYEALSRFSAEDGTARSPSVVFGRAEELGSTVAAEQVAATKALRLLDQMPGLPYVSLNLSPATVLTAETRHLLAQADLPRLMIEITENERVADYRAVTEALAPLRAAGMRLAVDDTGTGFAGMQHLALLAPDVIKLDIAFVRHADTDPTRRAVARAVSGFASEVGAVLVAEGVETPAEAATMRDVGARFAQGYLYGRPQPPHNFCRAAS